MYFRSWFFSCSFLVHMKGEKRLGILADSDVSAKRSCARGDAAFPLTQSTDFDSGSEGEDFTPSPPPRYSHNHIPKMAEFMTTFITRPIRAISFDFEQLVRDAAGLLNKPQVMHLERTHSGKEVCVICEHPICSFQVKLDYRPHSCGSPLRHLHLNCTGQSRDLEFPESEDLVSFKDLDFTPREQSRHLIHLRRSLHDARQVIDEVAQLHPVVRDGDAHVVELRRIELLEGLANFYPSMRRHILVQAGDPLPEELPLTPADQGSEPLNPVIFAVLSSNNMPVPLSSVNTERECRICVQAMRVGESVIKLRCSHEFHASCLNGWFTRTNICPIDKRNVETYYEDDI